MYPISWLGSELKFQPLFHGYDSNISLVFRALLFRYASYTHQKGPVLETGDGSPPRPVLKIFHVLVKVQSTRPWPEASPEVRIPLYTITLLLPPHHSLPDTSQCSGQPCWVLQTKNWDLNSPAVPWTYCKSVFIWGHVAGEQREEGGGEGSSHVFGATGPVVREGLHPPSVHCYRATVGFPGAVGGITCSRDKSGYTHTLWAPGFLCPTPRVRRQSLISKLLICTWCAGLAFRWPWSPASMYLMKTKWKPAACLLVLWNLASFPSLPAAIFSAQIITPASVQVYSCSHWGRHRGTRACSVFPGTRTPGWTCACVYSSIVCRQQQLYFLFPSLNFFFFSDCRG